MNPPGDWIDAHHHLWPSSVIPKQTWRPSEDGALLRAFEPADLEPELAAVGVNSTIVMQSVDDDAENDRLLAYARRADFIAGIVGYAPLRSPADARRTIEALISSGRSAALTSRASVVGVRCLIGHEDADWALARGALDNFKRMADAGLAWDIVPVTSGQVTTVAEVARRVPSLRIVVDHLARPPFSAEGWDSWSAAIARLAEKENIAIKLSVGVDVLGRPDDWDRGLLRSYVVHVLAGFGAERSMMASNWPVILLKAGYRRVWTDTMAVVEDVVGHDGSVRRVGSGTAREWYGLDRERT